ncbi:FAD-dependent monooxygenase [Streptomyces cyaneofuscatus]|uniref:FAD-dependent monooxygenase n=1 Tax=Streptomyces cyaneofuscatus TaxID=66883 RepID=UPI00378A1ADB
MAAATALRIGVVGGSIAGCAAAVAGSRAGADVTVYERSGAELQDRGFGIVIPPPLHRELVASGYLDARMETAPVAARVWLTREPGGRSTRELARQSSPVTPCNWGLLWRSLRANAAAGAGAGAVRYLRGEPVTSVDEGPDGRALVTTARGSEPYDIVVGADGHASRTRQLLAPGLAPEPAGYLVWRGAIPLSALAGHPRELELLRGAWVTLGFPGGHGIFYLIPGAGDRLLAYAIYGRPPAYPDADADPGPYVRELAREHFPAAWAEIVGHGTHRTTACHPVADVQVPRAARAPLLLAGDAAGVSRPHTASGAVKALQDALCLERVLRDEPTVGAALERYADERTAAGAHLVELGRRMGRAQVEETPDWAAMGQEEVDVWFRGVLAGTRHYLYEQPGAGVTA